MPRVRPRRRRRYRRAAGAPPAVSRYLRATAPGEIDRLDGGGYQGLSFGAEFCHRRLPPQGKVAEAALRCRAFKMGFSLVTPVVREGAFEAVSRWLIRAAQSLPGVECVFNDWGLLAWAVDRRLPVRPIAGRLLSRQRRGPRVVAMAQAAGPEEAEILRGSVWDDPVAARLLGEFGVGRVELDLLLQGTNRPSVPPGVRWSACAPWLPVTVTPSCPWSEDPLGCPRPCEDAPPVRLDNREDPRPLWSRGNARFVRLQADPLCQAVALGADRLIWAGELPG